MNPKVGFGVAQKKTKFESAKKNSFYTNLLGSGRITNFCSNQKKTSNFCFSNYSTTSLASKKSNELIQGGLSSIKSAANSMVKKLDEIKEAISTSATSTPVKQRNGESSYFSYDDCGNENRARKISSEFDSIKINCTPMKDIEEKLPSTLYPCPSEKHPGKIELVSQKLHKKKCLNHSIYTK